MKKVLLGFLCLGLFASGVVFAETWKERFVEDERNLNILEKKGKEASRFKITYSQQIPGKYWYVRILEDKDTGNEYLIYKTNGGVSIAPLQK